MKVLTVWRRVAGVRQTGVDPVVCSGCGWGRVLVVTRGPQIRVWSRLADGPWRAWCEQCWPHRCPGTSQDTSVCWLPVLWSGTWAELDTFLADRCPDDCAFCGGWLGPVEVASWTDDTQSPGEAWTYCRPCSLRQTRAGAWEPDETVAVLAPGGGTIAEQVAAVKAAHASRVPATALTVADLAPGCSAVEAALMVRLHRHGGASC